MNKPIITEEDKKLVGSLVKKKKQSGTLSMTTKKVKRINRVNVYYNKGGNGGTYNTGTFYSVKNNSTVKYRSSYELKFFQMLEKDSTIVNYAVEAFSVNYLDADVISRSYIPDVLALTTKGTFIVYEIKPEDMLRDLTVQKKAQACKKYIKQAFGPLSEYKFITEKYLFKNNKEYLDFLKEIKK